MLIGINLMCGTGMKLEKNLKAKEEKGDSNLIKVINEKEMIIDKKDRIIEKLNKTIES